MIGILALVYGKNSVWILSAGEAEETWRADDLWGISVRRLCIAPDLVVSNVLSPLLRLEVTTGQDRI